MLPAGFVEYISRYAELAPLATDLLTAPDVSVRINPAKPIAVVDAAGRVPWCDMGFYLDRRPQFTFDPALHQGRYYVQDASSMAIAAVVAELAVGRDVNYLDVCAAPGGKTTAALSVLSPDSVVVANEFDYRRAQILLENVSKWGSQSVMVTRGDTSRFAKLKECFDIVAVDAPCSGEGMMRKEPKAVEQWSPRLVEECAALQREIIGNVWSALRSGGYMIYSTCTFNRSEDEENLQWLIDTYGAEPVAIQAFANCEGICGGIDTPHPCYRFLPGRVRGEGLFMAVVRKPGVYVARDEATARRNKPAKGDKSAKGADKGAVKLLADIAQWVQPDMSIKVCGDMVYARPTAAAAFFDQISPMLDVLSEGVNIATVKGRDVVPTQQLALSLALNASAFAHVDVDRETAIKYLRREAVELPAATTRGYVLLIYDGYPLGFVKNLGNRSNNLYPKHWRIISQL